MSKIVTLTDLKITQMLINYELEHVYVEYNLMDADGKVWSKGSALFWVTLPSDPRENDFQLPTSYLPTLISLRDAADAALSAKYLE